MKRYIRYGEIPENEKSINFIKLSFDENADFTYFFENGMNRIEALKAACKRRINSGKITLDDILEPGVSVFNADENGNPIIENEAQRISLETRLKQNKKAYIVTGEEVGKGQDEEPLIINIEIIEKE